MIGSDFEKVGDFFDKSRQVGRIGRDRFVGIETSTSFLRRFWPSIRLSPDRSFRVFSKEKASYGNFLAFMTSLPETLRSPTTGRKIVGNCTGFAATGISLPFNVF